MRNYLEHMFADNGLVEVRALGVKTQIGVFDNLEDMCRGVRQINQSGLCTGIYTTLNAPSLRKATNRMTTGKGVRDQDIIKITRLPFDFDPVRPSGMSSSKEELQLARNKMIEVLKYLSSLGWPQPLIAMSGNGYHLQYRVDLKPSRDLKAILKNLYRGLDKKFSSETVKFDSTVNNPGRIFRLYGTTARKGEDLIERPHRITQCKTPDGWDILAENKIVELAHKLAPKTPYRPVTPSKRMGNGNYKTLDIVSWFISHDLYKKYLWDNKHSVCCPWEHEHSTVSSEDKTDTVIFINNNAWPGFYCSHNSCEGRGIKEVMELLKDQDRFCGVAHA